MKNRFNLDEEIRILIFHVMMVNVLQGWGITIRISFIIGVCVSCHIVRLYEFDLTASLSLSFNRLINRLCTYSWLSLSRTRKGPENLFEIERVRDRERKIGYILHKGTETLVRDRERFEIEGVRDRESQLYTKTICKK